MKCPYCKNHRDRVVDSRTVGSGSEIRRRRKCLSCGRRFTTYERIQESVLYVVKKDGRREPYNRLKVLEGIQRACEKRPISRSDVENIVNKVELDLYEHFDREVTSRNIGELVMRELKGIDHVAYVRFASVYRAFEDSWEFSKIAAELGGTVAGRSRSSPRDTSEESPEPQHASPCLRVTRPDSTRPTRDQRSNRRVEQFRATRHDLARLMKHCSGLPLDKALRQFPMFEAHKIEALYQALAAEPSLRVRIAERRKWYTSEAKSGRPTRGSAAAADDLSPYQHNAIRALEESCEDM